MDNTIKSYIIGLRNNILLYVAGIFFYLNETKFTLPLENIMVKD